VTFLALGFACLSAVQLVRSLNQKPIGRKQTLTDGATVRQFWSGIFHQDGSAQVVLDDASLDFYQEALGHPVALAEYFDRSYLHPAEEAAAAAHLDPKLVHSFLLRRQSNFADVNLVGRLSQTAAAFGSSANIGFARSISRNCFGSSRRQSAGAQARPCARFTTERASAMKPFILIVLTAGLALASDSVTCHATVHEENGFREEIKHACADSP
jgi:hypothetical protein